MSDKRDWHSRIVGYGGAVMAALALYYAHLSYEQQAEQVQYSRETRLQIVASIVQDSIYFDVDPYKTRLLGDFDPLYCSTSLYIWIKMHNGSEHAVTIDSLVGYYAGKCTKGFPPGCHVASKCVYCTGNPLCSFPIRLEPNELVKVMMMIPWVTSEYAYKRLGRSGHGRVMYPAEVVARLDTSFMGPIPYGLVWAPHIPTLLASPVYEDTIRCFKMWEATSVDHSFIVQATLGSGDTVTFQDYLPEARVFVVGGHAKISEGSDLEPTLTFSSKDG